MLRPIAPGSSPGPPMPTKASKSFDAPIVRTWDSMEEPSFKVKVLLGSMAMIPLT
jgi:hypothetical protein